MGSDFAKTERNRLHVISVPVLTTGNFLVQIGTEVAEFLQVPNESEVPNLVM
jgi:hypothetical protein